MADVARGSVRGVTQWNDIPRRHRACRCAVGAWEGTEIVVESTVLFDDEDNVLDLLHAWIGGSDPRKPSRRAHGWCFGPDSPDSTDHDHNKAAEQDRCDCAQPSKRSIA